MGAIFLSYAREDRVCAELLARVLTEAGHDLWWDRRIDGGSEFAAEIEAELEKADVVLVAWSNAAAQSRWVRDEAAVGADTGRLVPISIDGSLPPMGFRQLHTLELTGWKGGKKDSRTAELLHAVERKLKGEKGPGLSTTPRRKSARGTPRWAIAAALVLLVGLGIIIFLNNRDQVRGPAPKPTIALLPLTSPSADDELQQLAAQTRESIAHTFSQSGLPVRLLNAIQQDGSRAADFMISGDFSRNSDKVVASIRLDEAAHQVTVFSHRFEADRKDVRELPELIGAQMAGNLTWSYPLKLLDRRRPIDPSLLADLLQGADFAGGLDSLKAYQSVKRVAAKAPDLEAAQIGFAFDTAFVLSQLPRQERGAAVAEARRAAERASALEPDFGDSYGAWCVLRSETLRAECEDRLRHAKRIDPDAPFLNTFLSNLLRDVGRFDEATSLAKLSHSHDVYVPAKIAWMLKATEYAGDSDEARELYERGVRWWPGYQPMFFRNRMYGLIERGDFGAVGRLEQDLGSKNLPPGYQDSVALIAALKSKSVVIARRACPDIDAYLLNVRCMLVKAILGDLDGAYMIADRLYPRRVGRTPAETERIWLDEPEGRGAPEFITSPAAAPMRRDPRYLQVAERMGLLAYWRSGRPPDFCRKKPEPICAQLMKRS